MAPAYDQARIVKVGILGVTPIDGKRGAIMIPVGATIGVIRRTGKLAAVIWDGQEIEVFTEDLLVRTSPSRR